jgi:hypothetical protein
VEVAGEAGTRLNFVFLGVGADLVGVHAHHGDLDGAHEVEVVVAQVVGRSFEVILVEGAGVVGDAVQDWLSCSHGGLVGDQVEVEFSVTLLLDDTSVNDGTGARVEAVLVLLVEETMLDVAVNQAEDDLGLVSLRGRLQHVGDDLHLMFLDLSSHGGTAHAVSVNDDLLGEPAGVLLEVPDGLADKVLDDLSPLNCGEDLLDLSPALVFVLFGVLLGDFGEFLLVHFGEALGEVFVGSGAAPDEFAAPAHDEVDADGHGVAEVRHIQAVEVESHLGVHLLEEVRQHTHGDTLGAS